MNLVSLPLCLALSALAPAAALTASVAQAATKQALATAETGNAPAPQKSASNQAAAGPATPAVGAMSGSPSAPASIGSANGGAASAAPAKASPERNGATPAGLAGAAPRESAAGEAAASAGASTASSGETAPPAAGTHTRPAAPAAASAAPQAPGGKKKTASKISRTPKKPEAPSRPMNIRSKSFEVLPGAQRAQWKGNVVVERDDMQVFCDVMTAEYGEDKKIKRLTCSGEVHMLQKPATGEQREAWGDLAVFDNSTGVLTVTPASSMTGDKKVRAREGANTMSGDKVTFFVAENRLVVDNSVTIIDMNQVPGVEPKGAKDSKP